MEGGTPIESPLKSNCWVEAPATLGDGERGSQPGGKQLGGEDRGPVIGGDPLCEKNGEKKTCLLFPWRSLVANPEEDKGESGSTGISAWDGQPL